MPKLIKEYCEICKVKDTATLHLHHIIERTDINSTNHNSNLAIICANCHAKVHNNEITIIGIAPATIKPNSRILIYEINGIKNIDIEPLRVFKKTSFKLGGNGS
jgi:hypothetical protein